jgi:dephospho-CoA kinase
LLRRDGIDATLADSIIGSQASRARRLSLATDVIVNDASPDAVEAPVRRLHARFVGFASIAGLA